MTTRDRADEDLLPEDALWTAAMEGVLARLEQLPGHEINTLLPPRRARLLSRLRRAREAPA